MLTARGTLTAQRAPERNWQALSVALAKRAPGRKRGTPALQGASRMHAAYGAAVPPPFAAAPHATREASAAAEEGRAAEAQVAAAGALDVALAAARRVLDADATLNSADAMDALVARHGQVSAFSLFV